jgi:hypothetical protein
VVVVVVAVVYDFPIVKWLQYIFQRYNYVNIIVNIIAML